MNESLKALANSLEGQSDHPPLKTWEVCGGNNGEAAATDIIGFVNSHCIYGEFLGGIPEVPLEVFRKGNCSKPLSFKIKFSNSICELGIFPLEVPAFTVHYEAFEGRVKRIDFRIKPDCVFNAPLVMQGEIILPGGMSATLIDPTKRFCILEVQSLQQASPKLKAEYERRASEKRYYEVALPADSKYVLRRELGS